MFFPILHLFNYFLPFLHLLGQILYRSHFESEATQLAIDIALLRSSLALFSRRVYPISTAPIESHTCCGYVVGKYPCDSSNAVAVCIRIFRKCCLPASFEDKSAAEAGRGQSLSPFGKRSSLTFSKPMPKNWNWPTSRASEVYGWTSS